MKIPRRLRKDPILEAIVEIRFEASQDNVASILPGLLFSKLRDASPHLETLIPIGALPTDLLKMLEVQTNSVVWSLSSIDVCF